VSIADDATFKQDRAKALKSGNAAEIRLWATKYGIKLPMDDAEILRLALLAPNWD